MKDRGKAVAVSNNNCFSDYHYYSSSSSDLPCKKHPSSSTVGICAFCLKDRLIKLVCSDCGEQRLSSCSCSDISSSYPNSCSVEIGSVGRISFLIENDKEEIPHSNTNPLSVSEEKSESNVLLKRSNSSSFDVKRGGFWSFGRFFRKKRDKGFGFSGVNVDGDVEKGETWVVKNIGVSRSRSVGCFRGGFDNSEDGFTVSDSGFKGIKKSGFIDLDDGGFTGVGDSGFIDLKLDSSLESKPEFSSVKSGDFLESESGFRVSKDSHLSEHESHSLNKYLRGKISSNGSSCRITVNDEEMKKCKKRLKVWKWMLKHHHHHHHHSSGGSTTWNKDKGHACKS